MDQEILTAKDGTRVIASPEHNAAKSVCEGCIFDKHEGCSDFSGSRLTNICCSKPVIFIAADEVKQGKNMETINKLYLDLSEVATVETKTERNLQEGFAVLQKGIERKDRLLKDIINSVALQADLTKRINDEIMPF